MLNNDEILDRNILSDFQNIFKAMNIREYQIVTAIQNFSLPPLDFETREKLSTDGLLAAENFADEWIEIAEPQLYFKYKKNVVIMYQHDQFLPQYDYNQQRYRPFHLCFCQALQDAHEKNRYESRYVMTYNTSGNFKVNLFVRDTDSDGNVYTLKKEQEVYRPLKVCQHCLREINWKHFRSYCGSGLEWWRGGNSYMRKKIVDEFDLEEYLVTARQNNFFDHPVLGTASSSIKKEYVLSPQIKEELKKIVEYTCEICRNQFPSEELKIHHKNHNEGDNRRQNLMVVCERCHALIHDAEGGFVSSKEKSVKPIEVISDKKSFSDDATRQKRLGDMIFNGWGVPKDESKAQMFYRNAVDGYKVLAQKQDVDAWYELAICYRFGLGVNKNLKESERRFKNVFPRYKSRADQGDVKAKIRLGLMYAQGFGVAKNINAAKKIIDDIRKKVEVADSELVELCVLAGNIDDALKFHAKAMQLWQLAAEHGDKTAPYEIARLYGNADLFGSEFENFSETVSSQEKIERQEEFDKNPETFIKLANQGDVDTILKLKEFAKDGNETAKDALEKLYWDGKKEHAVGTVVIRDGVNSIKYEAFKYCTSLKKIVLPDGLTKIYARAFYYCTNLTEINLPESVTFIGVSAFYGCKKLLEIKLPDGLTYIGDYTFYDCSSLKEINLPDTLTEISHAAFYGCTSLKKITYSKKIESCLKKIFDSKWYRLEKIVRD